MKFAVFTVVVLALVFQAQSSVIPIGLGSVGPVLSATGPLSPIVVPGGSVAIQASVIQPNEGSVAVQVPNVIPVGSVPSVVSVAQSVIQPIDGSVAVQVPNLISVQGVPSVVNVAQSVVQPIEGSVAVQVPNVIPSVEGVRSVVSVAQSPVAVAVQAPVVVAAEGKYVAKTRGAVHVAPLAGHVQSAASINLQPAPGTL